MAMLKRKPLIFVKERTIDDDVLMIIRK